MAEPATKRAKTDDGAAAALDEEAEEDYQADIHAKIQATVVFHVRDTTMNVMPSSFGNLLVPLSDGGLQYLLAGARSNVGIKSGRYMYEARIVESPSTAEEVQAKGKVTLPKQVLRLGFGLQGGSLLLGEGLDAAFFDSAGFFWSGKEKHKVSLPFGCGDTVGVILNLEVASSNCLTISLFINGKRACKPQGLPQAMVGKALFPTVSFKGVTVHHHFGPEPLEPLPFKCRMVQDARVRDAEISTVESTQPRVFFPVALPDEGAFDWLDHFLSQHPHVTELSDRAILQWAERSGIVRAKGYAQRTCNDKPEYGFGMASLDDGSIRRGLLSVAPLQRRDYVVMEVRGNLLKTDRAEMLARWSGTGFKVIACVAMGSPPQAIKEHNILLTLREKQAQSDAEFKKKLEDERRKREAAKKKKAIEKQRALMLKKQKKAAEKARRKLENDKKRKEAEAKGEAFVEDEEPADEENEEEDADEEAQPIDETPPEVVLAEDEKAVVFRKAGTPDLTPFAMSTSFAKFSLPRRDEGFDVVAFEWALEAKCQEHLKTWVQAKKTTTRIEDLKPGEWFTEKQKDWAKLLQIWHTKYTANRAASIKRATERSAKKAAAKAAAEKRPAAMDEKSVVGSKELGAASASSPPASQPEEDKTDSMGKEVDEEKAAQACFDKLDVYGVEDVTDIGNGEPLFSRFAFEDWALVCLRVELHLLVHAFTKDVDDQDRGGIHVDHLCFYYQKYFKKTLNVKLFGVETVQSLLALVRDAVALSRKGQALEAQVPDNFESMNIFVMLQEEARRDRLRRIDLGDESAKLKVQQSGPLSANAPPSVRQPTTLANPKAVGGTWQKSTWQAW